MLPILFLLVAQGPSRPFDRIEMDPVAQIPITYEQDGMMDLDAWGLEFIYPVVKPLATSEIPRSRRSLQRAFNKYPTGFIRKHIDRIFVCGDLTVDGYEYGATYGPRTLFIVNAGERAGFDDRFIEQSFHHEFSSILLLEPKSKFPKDKWIASNPKGFSYKGYDEVYADKKSAVDWEQQKPTWLRMGFIKRYSFTSLEEDLNTIAESMFAGGTKFWRQADRSPGILKKVRIYLQYLNALQPGFREPVLRTYR